MKELSCRFLVYNMRLLFSKLFFSRKLIVLNMTFSSYLLSFLANAPTGFLVRLLLMDIFLGDYVSFILILEVSLNQDIILIYTANVSCKSVIFCPVIIMITDSSQRIYMYWLPKDINLSRLKVCIWIATRILMTIPFFFIAPLTF